MEKETPISEQTERPSHSLTAEIVTTGTEILLGEIVDTNAAWIARQLREIGVNLYYKTTVGDNEPRLRGVLQQALARSDVVIVTGGLGPTVDDITREAIANATGRRLILHKPTLEALRKRFARWGAQMSENNQRQAYIPEGASIVPNPVGTAPGILVETEPGSIIALPGVPREMKRMMQDSVLPYLQARSGAVIRRRILRTVGIGESSIDSRIHDLMHRTNPTVGLAAHLGQTDIRITARAATPEEADALLDELEAEIRSRLGPYIYSSTPGETVEAVVARALQEQEAQVALYETDPAGSLAQRLGNALEGHQPVAAALSGRQLTTSLLSPELQERLRAGEVSQELAQAVAEALRQATGAMYGLAVLSTAREGEGAYGDETGQSWMAVAAPDGGRVRPMPYGGTDELTVAWVGNRALDLLRRQLLAIPSA